MTIPNPRTQSFDSDVTKSTARRPYERPRLEHLGTVRELTLGSVGSNMDNPPLCDAGRNQHPAC